jgi:hypothetical protein
MVFRTMMADYAFGLGIAFIIGCSLYFGPRIKSNRMAMQWRFDGKPTWHAPKLLGLWFGGIRLCRSLANLGMHDLRAGKGPRRRGWPPRRFDNHRCLSSLHVADGGKIKIGHRENQIRPLRVKTGQYPTAHKNRLTFLTNKEHDGPCPHPAEHQPESTPRSRNHQAIAACGGNACE